MVITVDNQARTARLVLHWKGGMVSETSADLPRPKPPYRTSEDTISLIGRLAAHYDDSMIAKVLNQQQRRTAKECRSPPLTWPPSANETPSPPAKAEQATTKTAR